MSEHVAKIIWQKSAGAAFVDNAFSRHHVWEFDGGLTVPASASPHIVPVPMSVEENIDPEEAYVAALSSCHMLWFLAIAARRKFVVDSYVDAAKGVMAENTEGKLTMTRVTLRPKVTFAADTTPAPDKVANMHHLAHDSCFIANSVKTQVIVEPVEG